MVILKILRAGPASQWTNQTVQAPWCAPVLPVRVDRKPDSHTRRDVGRTGQIARVGRVTSPRVRECSCPGTKGTERTEFLNPPFTVSKLSGTKELNLAGINV